MHIWNICKECASTVYSKVQPSEAYANRTARLLFGTAAQESGLVWERQRSLQFDSLVGGFSKWQLEKESVQASLQLFQFPSQSFLLKTATNFLFCDPHAPVTWATHYTLDEILEMMTLDNNDKIGCLFARMHYFRVPSAIPESLEEQAAYYKQYYNSPLGAATVEQYIDNYNRLCQPVVEEIN
jgi:hypothetical protein